MKALSYICAICGCLLLTSCTTVETTYRFPLHPTVHQKDQIAGVIDLTATHLGFTPYIDTERRLPMPANNWGRAYEQRRGRYGVTRLYAGVRDDSVYITLQAVGHKKSAEFIEAETQLTSASLHLEPQVVITSGTIPIPM